MMLRVVVLLAPLLAVVGATLSNYLQGNKARLPQTGFYKIQDKSGQASQPFLLPPSSE